MNRQKFNYHTHTFRCGHALLCEDEEYVKAAIDAGFETLGFSDHAPYYESEKPEDRMSYKEMEGYLKSIEALREKYLGKIRILKGFECEYFDEHRDLFEELKAKTDYLLLGQHYPRADGEVNMCSRYVSEEDLEAYEENACKGMESGYFLYLAHPDYYCGGVDDFNDQCRKIAENICRYAEKTHTPLEVNIKLKKRKPIEYTDGMHVMYPFRAFWEIASHRNIECIYGFDAHRPDSLLDMSNYEKADEILKGLPLRFVKKELI